MGSISAEAKLPWIETPLISSPELSRAAGCNSNILLKLENLQPSGSFKSRGVGNLVLRAVAASASADVHFYCSSGGNAGLACATSAAALGLAATSGNANPEAQSKEGGGGSGRSSSRRPRAWTMPQLVRLSAAAGLVNGLLQGLEDVERDGGASAPWPRGRPPTVVAVETRGAESLHASVEAGRLVTLPAITSIATSLGAVRVSERTWEWARRKAVLGPRRQAEHGGRKMGPAGLESLVVSDAEAAMACVRFAHDARFVVEVACGATVAVCYNGALRETLGRGLSDDEWRRKNVVVVVCGGSNVSLEVLEEYKATYAHMV
ncbi:L-serine dehydratase [Verticillium dahliae VdLs.17]|uniref:L-serine ammonia-lyase n=1 Tax=Verticillium dahliae (strain VdLs.17 / ATCC MYA-4575 / FGSC 10137) TaxID=498257 RepID=G2XII8_VERDV|nr:L-serine dehydratase [Verticillium dahliae VdLs.17]EGY20341.1 L-serine dehydratase [Verticillium dahliae VdLs.17]